MCVLTYAAFINVSEAYVSDEYQRLYLATNLRGVTT
jgi:hypothetical protein